MKKRFLALAIVLGTGLLSGCTNAGEKTAVSYKGGTISEQEVMDSLKKNARSRFRCATVDRLSSI